MCKFSIKRKKGVTEWIDCQLDGKLCAFQRYCHTKGSVINSEKFSTCLNLKREEKDGETNS